LRGVTCDLAARESDVFVGMRRQRECHILRRHR
jgi:hypothetical protein